MNCWMMTRETLPWLFDRYYNEMFPILINRIKVASKERKPAVYSRARPNKNTMRWQYGALSYNALSILSLIALVPSIPPRCSNKAPMSANKLSTTISSRPDLTMLSF